MKIAYKRSREKTRQLRQDAYLRLWPVEKQLEAITEAANGRTGKMDAMAADFAAIRASLPYEEEQTWRG